MKKRILIFIFLLIFNLVKSQFAALGVNSDGFETFKGAKNISVVLTGDNKTDNALKDAIVKNWTLTPVVYINSADVENKINDNTTCFMLPIEIQNDKGQSYNFFAILPGGKKKLNKYDYGDLLAYCPIDKLLSEPTINDVAFRFPLIITSLQNVLIKVEKGKMTGNSFSLGKDFNEINCKNVKKIKVKTLLINSAFGMTEEDVKEEYKYKFEICDKSKIETAIKNKDANYLVFQPAITMNKFIFIFDCETNNCVYSSINLMGMKVKQKDFKEIIEQLKN